MSSIVVRNIPDEIHAAIQMLAKMHGRSTEAEVRHILSKAVEPEVKMGEQLIALSRQIGLKNSDVEALEKKRKRIPADPMSFDQ